MGCDDYSIDLVQRPRHYTSHPAGIQAIEVLRYATDWDLGQAMRYCWRVMWGSKGRDYEDVQKAAEYLKDWLDSHEELASS